LESVSGSVLTPPSSRKVSALINPLILNLEQRDRLSDEERRMLEGIIARTRTVNRGEDMVREGFFFGPCDASL